MLTLRQYYTFLCHTRSWLVGTGFAPAMGVHRNVSANPFEWAFLQPQIASLKNVLISIQLSSKGAPLQMKAESFLCTAPTYHSLLHKLQHLGLPGCFT